MCVRRENGKCKKITSTRTWSMSIDRIQQVGETVGLYGSFTGGSRGIPREWFFGTVVRTFSECLSFRDSVTRWMKTKCGAARGTNSIPSVEKAREKRSAADVASRRGIVRWLEGRAALLIVSTAYSKSATSPRRGYSCRADVQLCPLLLVTGLLRRACKGVLWRPRSKRRSVPPTFSAAVNNLLNEIAA